ncbi:MAG: HNH endonuclease [Flavobacteriaceae bacterium]|jgi:putative restriction endonuclease|nr:HNH endonuclease [Flavobacteriaceae bacterium]
MKRIFGEIEGFKEGHQFNNRMEISISGIHRPPQAGISGSQNEGADSIVISGGYEDDKDFGNEIIYTGHGGRSNETGKQVADQQLTRQNLALAKSCLEGLPIRVIRGRHKGSKFGPDEGYRYDGLYLIEKYWKKKGKSGYYVFLFKLIKIEKSISNIQNIVEESPEEYQTKRVSTQVQRIIRNTQLSRKIKDLYNYKCQICNTRIETSSGYYAEAAHIKPLGSPHNGPDVIENLLCLCPNHHVMFDFGGFSILPNLDIIGIEGGLTVHKKHKISIDYLSYHFEHFYDERNKKDF